MLHQADSHNFGQRVTKLDWASGSFFQKPRPIFWEWFFFGNTSPLCDLYRSAAPWFNLEIDFDSDGVHGRAREVIGQNDADPNDLDFLNFGRLLAYCYIF